MLRQVFLYYKNEKIFSYYFANAYDNSSLDTIINQRVKNFISDPTNGKMYNKIIFDYQSHFGMFNDVFFLFVTDKADRPKIIQKELNRAANLFKKEFSDPLSIKEESTEREEFTEFIKETHYYLHPKMVLVGPIGSGKTTITKLMGANKPEKKIMNFAEYFQIHLDDIFFDLWDFIEKEDFSPLWNNYSRGSDFIFLVLDGTELKILRQKVEFFTSLVKREGKYSEWAVILTHSDSPEYITSNKLKETYEIFNNISIFEINLVADDAKENIKEIFREIIGLKKALPADFKNKVQTANQFVSQEKYSDAINVLKELVNICDNYQELSYLEIFNKKISELEEKLIQEKEKEEIEKKKIKQPKKISFGKFKGVNSLPTLGDIPPAPKINTDNRSINGANESSIQKKEIKMSNIPEIELELPKMESLKNPFFKTDPSRIIDTELQKENDSQNLSHLKEEILNNSISMMKNEETQKKDIQSNINVSDISINPTKIPPINPILEIPEDNRLQIQKSSNNDSERLGEEIRNLGESLSLKLCEKFTEQLKIKLKKPILTEEEITKAAQLFVNQRRKKRSTN